jgi:hypothetical protein
MTTRRWMVAVAMIAFAIESVKIGERWLSYRQRAVYHARLAETGMDLAPSGDAALILSPRDIAYHGELKVKYERAATRPWLPVEPDPPPPP